MTITLFLVAVLSAPVAVYALTIGELRNFTNERGK